MNKRLIFLIITFVTFLNGQQKVDLSGKVIDLAGNGVENVTVGLIKGNLTTTTNQDGEFELKGVITSIKNNSRIRVEEMRIHRNNLIFSVSSAYEPVHIAMYSARGIKVMTVVNRLFQKGTHTVRLLSLKQKFANSYYIVSIKRSQHTYRFGITVLNNNITGYRHFHFDNSNVTKVSTRYRAAVDTLYAQLQGVDTEVLPTETYIDSNIIIGMRIVPEFYVDKAKGTPDYSQMDNAYGGLAGNGSFYCGPCSVSNGIMWLDDNGYPNLVENTSDRKKDQHDMIIVMGSKKYMNTENVGMAPSRDVVRGVEDYIEDKGYKCNIEFQGIYYPPPDKYIDSNRVVIDWIKEKVLGNTAVYLHVSWVRYDQSTDTYTARGGHWNTVTGYGKTSNGTTDARYLLNHDPSKPSDKTEYTRPTKFTSGTYKRGSKSWDLTTGFYKYKGGVLDGIVAVKMIDD